MIFDIVHYVPIWHPRRDQRKVWHEGSSGYAKEWEYVWMVEMLPDYRLMNNILHFIECQFIKAPTH
jgi:hypothetical protein